jgi:hypothetical protein
VSVSRRLIIPSLRSLEMSGIKKKTLMWRNISEGRDPKNSQVSGSYGSERNNTVIEDARLCSMINRSDTPTLRRNLLRLS